MGKSYDILVDEDDSNKKFSLFDLILSSISYFKSHIFPVFEKYFMAFVIGFLAIGAPAFLAAFVWGIMPPALPGAAMTTAGAVFLGASFVSAIFEMVVQAWNGYIEDNLIKIKGLKKASKSLNKEAKAMASNLTKYLAWARGKLLQAKDPRFVCDDERPKSLLDEDINKVLDGIEKLKAEVKEGIAEAEEVNSKVNTKYFFAVAKSLITIVASAGLPIFCVLTTNAVVLTVPLILFNAAICLSGVWGVYQAIKYFNAQTQGFFDHKLAVEKLRDQDSDLSTTAATLTKSKNSVADFNAKLDETKSAAITDVKLESYEFENIELHHLESALSSKTAPLWSFAQSLKKMGTFSEKLAGDNHGTKAPVYKSGFQKTAEPDVQPAQGSAVF